MTPNLSGLPQPLVLAITVLAVGLMICRVIGGFKDQPGFADFFAVHPQASRLLNAVFSLLSGLTACLAMGVKDVMGFAECLLMAAATFYAASGWHRNDKRQGPALPPAGAGPVATEQLKADVAATATPPK